MLAASSILVATGTQKKTRRWRRSSRVDFFENSKDFRLPFLFLLRRISTEFLVTMEIVFHDRPLIDR